MSYDKKYLYRLTFPNGKVYIGTTKDVRQRWVSQGAAYNGSVVGEAIREFGWDNVKKDVLLYLQSGDTIHNNDIILKMERELIRAYGEKSYNLTVWNGAYPEGRYVGKTVCFNGEEKTYAQWQRDPRVKVSGATIRSRIVKGWSIEKALFTPSLTNVSASPAERRRIWASYRQLKEV